MNSQHDEVLSNHGPEAKTVTPRSRRRKWGLMLPLGAAMLICGAHAQTTNVYDGVAVELTNDLYVGYTNSYDQLQVINGAALLDTNGYSVYVGYDAGANGNSVLVSSGAEMDFLDLYVGYYGSGNSLTISGGGVIDCSGDNCWVGYLPGSDNNSVVVTGSGTVWTSLLEDGIRIGASGNGNSLLISNGAAVVSGTGSVGSEASSPYYGSNNSVVITGPGSLWTNAADGEAFVISLTDFNSGNSVLVTNGGSLMSPAGITIGGVSNNLCVTGNGSVGNFWGHTLSLGYSDGSGGGNTLEIANGGLVTNYDAYIGTGNIYNNSASSSDHNQAVVSGTGSIWSSAYLINVGDTGSGNSLLVSDGGTVVTANLTVGANRCFSVNPGASNNVLTVSSGTLIVTNVFDNGHLSVGAAGAGPNRLVLSDGLVTANVLEVYSNSVVAGCGTINGTVVIDPGGTVLASCGGSLNFNGNVTNNGTLRATNGGVLGAFGVMENNGVVDVVNGAAGVLEVYSNSIVTGCGTINGTVVIAPGGTVLASCGGSMNFTGSVTNNGTMRAINGSVLSVAGMMENNGVIDIINGATNFSGGFVNNGRFLTASSVQIEQASVSGQDVLVHIASVVGHTYRLQYTTSLAPASWADTGPTQAGTGGVLTFTDPGVIGTGPNRFYHIVVTAP